MLEGILSSLAKTEGTEKKKGNLFREVIKEGTIKDLHICLPFY